MRKKSIVILLLLIIAFSSLYSTSNQRILFKYKFTAGEKYYTKLIWDSRWVWTHGKWIREFTERKAEFITLNVSSNNDVVTFLVDWKPCIINGKRNDKYRPFKLTYKLNNKGKVLKMINYPSMYPLFKNHYQNHLIFPSKSISQGQSWKSVVNIFHNSEPAKVSVIAKFIKLITYKGNQVAVIRYSGKKYNVSNGIFVFDILTVSGMEYFDYKNGRSLFKKVNYKYYMLSYHGRKPPVIVTSIYERNI